MPKTDNDANFIKISGKMARNRRKIEKDHKKSDKIERKICQEKRKKIAKNGQKMAVKN